MILSVDDAIENIVKENDRIDVLVNNAGYDLFGSLEESSLEKIKEQFETPVFFFYLLVSKLGRPTKFFATLTSGKRKLRIKNSRFRKVRFTVFHGKTKTSEISIQFIDHTLESSSAL